jgi:hypothetical protein
MPRKLDVSVNVPPYGISATPFAGGARLMVKARTGEELFVDLPRLVAETLCDEIEAALEAEA